jgi:beta-galactosidase
MTQDVFRFGVDYYPEQWEESRWPIDAALMAEAGFNVVRLAEFAWAKLEPTPGHFDFSWLDRAIEVLSQRGIQVVLGTPTASPPAWVMAQHPDAYRVSENGVRATYGNRRNYCPNNPNYHTRTREIVSAMTGHYANHHAVIGWQIDNEFGQGDRCCCPICIAAFQRWLEAKYGSLDDVNAAWGTIFWSHTYTAWSQIPAPLKSAESPNPGLALDYYRFSSDSYVAYQHLQAQIIRQNCPDVAITHNFMGFGFGQIDYFRLANDIDFVSWDNYPRMQWTWDTLHDPARIALAHDSMRGLKRQNFWVMEQQAGPGGWEIVSQSPQPGELRLWAYQSIAHGADGIVFFRWRTARYGTEQYWHGVLDHHARPGRRFDEIKRMGAELQQIGQRILGTQVSAQTAILHDYDTRFAFQIQHNHPDFEYSAHILDIYRALYQQKIQIDVINVTEILNNYSLVIAPALHVITQAIADNLCRYVEQGGTLIITPRSGVKDEANAVVNAPLPGLLATLYGVEVVDYEAMSTATQRAIRLRGDYNEEQMLIGRLWCDVLEPTTAEIVAVYADGHYAGKTAVTRNYYGKGQAITVGTFADTKFYRTLIPLLCEVNTNQHIVEASEGVEVLLRKNQKEQFLFLMNHTGESQRVSIKSPCLPLLDTTQTWTCEIELAPYDVCVALRQQ